MSLLLDTVQKNRRLRSAASTLTLPTAKAGGSRFSEYSTVVASYALSPSVRFCLACPVLPYKGYAKRRRPSFKMFFAVFTSLLWAMPHEGQVHSGRTNPLCRATEPHRRSRDGRTGRRGTFLIAPCLKAGAIRNTW